MPLPAAFWVLLGARVLFAFLCRRWTAATVYAASAALCDVARAVLLAEPETEVVLAADAALFIVPTAILARACGASIVASVGVIVIAPLALHAGAWLGPDARRLVLVLGTTGAQGAIAVHGTSKEFGAGVPSWGRRAAVCLAASSLVGAAFVGRWPDVSFAGAAAYACVCVAYLSGEQK